MNVGRKKYKHFGDFLRTKRIEAGLTQEEAARKLGYSDRQFLSALENDRVSLPFPAIPKVAELYQISLHDLVEAVIEEQTRILRNKISDAVNKDKLSKK